MAKKNKTPKINVKVKKQIRRTVGALFMASAIVVAAVPVAPLQAGIKWEDAQTRDDDNRGNATYPTVDNTSPGWVASEPFLARPTTTVSGDPSGLKTSYTIYNLSTSDNPWVFVDQFYYSVHNNIPNTTGSLAIINGYSDLLPAEQIRLSNYLNTQYYTVTEKVFNEFFSGPTYITVGGSTNNDTWPGGGPGSEKYEYSYTDYVAMDSPEQYQPKTDKILFMERQEEWQADFNAYKEQCARYYQYSVVDYPQYLADLKAYEDALAIWEGTVSGNNAGNFNQRPPAVPTVVNKPGGGDNGNPFVRTPADLTFDKQRRFYCDWAENLPQTDPKRLPGLNFTLEVVADQVNRTDIYVPKGGTLIGVAGTALDDNGFLVTDRSEMVIGIGDNAFSGVGNVDRLNIPSEIKYIGDNAFSSSFIKAIEFTNITKIGNRAFNGCTQLASITLNDGARTIGAEAFRGSGIVELELPYSIDTIGTGAFAESQELLTVDMSRMNQNPTTINAYAFYDNPKLSAVNFPEIRNSFDIGEACFALKTSAQGALSTIILPKNITGVKGSALGNYLFAGRMGLKSVIMPESYGTDRLNGVVQIPSGMFLMCTGLDYVEFPNVAGGRNGGYASFQYADQITDADYPDERPDAEKEPYMGQYLFLDVVNPNFYVRGPEFSQDGLKALPRRSTWGAYTQASDFVPYKYIDGGGVECYEVSDGQYILQANDQGELTDCELVDDSGFNGSNYVDLIIPEMVGDIKITDIATEALSNKNLRDRMRSLTISDNSLTAVAPGAFAELPRLERVVIGNSVENIGEGAFKDCLLLEDVTFHTPLVGYDQFVIGTEAFKTNSRKLVFNGDIVPGYAPFEFAMDPLEGNIAFDINGDPTGLRILYKSLSPTLLTVMYDNDAEEVVLLNYPKFDRLDENNVAYRKSMETYYTQIYGSTAYDEARKNFVTAFLAAPDPEAREAVYNNPSLFGPWVSRSYLNDLGGSVSANALEALKEAEAYYERNEYSIIKNFYNTNPQDWERASLTESSMVSATKNIIIPEGVTSIDAKSYFDQSNGRVNSNRPNFSVYFNVSNPATNPVLDQQEWNMIMGDPGNAAENGVNVVSGLFSGYYEDFDSASDKEKQLRGNDQIERVVMSTVKELPPYAFDSCEGLTEVVLGAALTDIGIAPFRGASILSNVQGNEKYLVDKGIIYSKKADDSYRLEQTLSARGALVGESYVTTETDPLIANVSEIVTGAFEDCDVLNRVDLTGAAQLKIIPENCFNDCNVLRNIRLPESVNRIEEGAFGMNDSLNVYIPGYEVHIATNAFKLLPKTADPTTSHTVQTYQDTSAYQYVLYHRDTRGMGIDVEVMNDRYMVEFLDHDGIELIPSQRVGWGEEAIPPSDEVMAEYYARLATINREFVEWSKPFNSIKEHTTVIAITKNLLDSENMFTVSYYNYDDTLIYQQSVVPGENGAPITPPNRSGYTFTGWRPTVTNVQKDIDTYAQWVTGGNSGGSGSSSPSPSGSPTPTPTPGPNDGTKYTVSVAGGSGSGSYSAGTVVTISAYATGDAMIFDKWTTASTGVGFQNATSPMTSFVMPAGNVTVTATFKTALSSESGSGTPTSNNSGGGSGGSGDGSSGSIVNDSNVTVQITKPGIPSPDLASATVNGSSDNFVLKITEDPAATAAVVEALQKQYGDISNIRYSAMDISVYDASGITKLTDTTGLSFNITLPLPNDLVSYGGNNQAASAVGGTLENLNERFSTIDGVPCITFTATHFSPYTIYADTANLSVGMIDSTPKTGDLLHPKWFLVVGLASMSLLLFFKKDRMPKVSPV